MTKEQKETITRLRKDGQGYTAIAITVGLTKDCVKIWCQRHGLGGIAVKKAVPEPDTGICRNCGKPLVQIPGRKPRKFCCDDCRVAWWKEYCAEAKQNPEDSHMSLQQAHRFTHPCAPALGDPF